MLRNDKDTVVAIHGNGVAQAVFTGQDDGEFGHAVLPDNWPGYAELTMCRRTWPMQKGNKNGQRSSERWPRKHGTWAAYA